MLLFWQELRLRAGGGESNYSPRELTAYLSWTVSGFYGRGSELLRVSHVTEFLPIRFCPAKSVCHDVG